MAERLAARKSKNWALSDKLRNDAVALGYTIEDSPDGQKAKKI